MDEAELVLGRERAPGRYPFIEQPARCSPAPPRAKRRGNAARRGEATGDLVSEPKTRMAGGAGRVGVGAWLESALIITSISSRTRARSNGFSGSNGTSGYASSR